LWVAFEDRFRLIENLTREENSLISNIKRLNDKRKTKVTENVRICSKESHRKRLDLFDRKSEIVSSFNRKDTHKVLVIQIDRQSKYFKVKEGLSYVIIPPKKGKQTLFAITIMPVFKKYLFLMIEHVRQI
jgi:hypothetical protein